VVGATSTVVTPDASTAMTVPSGDTPLSDGCVAAVGG
jgi:hypothetical protein